MPLLIYDTDTYPKQQRYKDKKRSVGEHTYTYDRDDVNPSTPRGLIERFHVLFRYVKRALMIQAF